MNQGKYFSHDELKCRCGCGENKMDPDFLLWLDTLRTRFGRMPLSSAYRCPAHNANSSSTGATGPHTTGCAVDVAVSGHSAAMLVKMAMEMGAKGIGVKAKGPVSERFIHIDRKPGRDHLMIWSY